MLKYKENYKKMAKTLEPLEKRLESVGHTEEGVKDALEEQHINPRERWDNMPYLKSDLTVAIVNHFPGTSSEFSNTLYSSATRKEPLKRVYYGILSTGNLPEDFLQVLTDWEKIYFFAGRWAIRQPDLSVPFDVLTSEHLLSGIERLYSEHYTRKAAKTYKAEIILPESNRIRTEARDIIRKYQKKRDAREKKDESAEKPEPILSEQLKLF